MKRAPSCLAHSYIAHQLNLNFVASDKQFHLLYTSRETEELGEANKMRMQVVNREISGLFDAEIDFGFSTSYMQWSVGF